jgi:hypothetical protein
LEIEIGCGALYVRKEYMVGLRHTRKILHEHEDTVMWYSVTDPLKPQAIIKEMNAALKKNKRGRPIPVDEDEV